jgi:hypothetical protein
MAGQPYRAPILVPPDPYLVAWRDLERRRRVAAWFFALVIPVGSGAVVAFGPLAGAVVIFALTIAAGVTSEYRARFRCPRCLGLYDGSRDWDRSVCTQCAIAFGTAKSTVVAAEKAARLVARTD